MAVNKAPVRQQSYLTEYDRQMAEYLRQMSGSIGPQDIASEAYGGKFPVGTMTAKILSSVLAGGADRRAMNRDAQSKRAAVELMKTPQTEITQDTAVGDAIYDPNTDSYSTMSLAPVVAGVERQTRPEFNAQNLSNVLKKEPLNIGEGAESVYTPMNEREVLKPREFTSGMTIPGSAENPNYIQRKLGAVGGETVNSRAELAQLAKYDALQFSEYEQNKRIQDRTLQLAEQERLRALQPQVERTIIYNKEGGMETAYKRIDPVTNRTYFSQEPNANVPFGPEYTIEPPKEIKQASTKAVLNTVTNEIEFATEKEITESKNTLVPLPKEESETAFDKKYDIFLNSEIERNSKLPEDKKLSIKEIQRIAATLASTTRTQELDPNLSQDAIKAITNIESKVDIPTLDIRLMSKADVMGAAKGAINFAAGLRGGKVPFQNQVQAGANLEAINNKIKIEMVKEISAKGSVYTQKKIEALLPSTKNSDSSNYAIIQSLIPLLKNKLEEAEKVLINSNTIYPNDKKRASKALQDAISVKNQLQQIIPVLNDSIIQFDSNYSNTKNPFTEYTDEEFNNITEDDLKEDN